MVSRQRPFDARVFDDAGAAFVRAIAVGSTSTPTLVASFDSDTRQWQTKVTSDTYHYAFPPQVAVVAKQMASAGVSKADDAPASIKFIGATPRGASCEDQVWPYIERHCLRGALDKASSAGPGSLSRNSRENSKQRGAAE